MDLGIRNKVAVVTGASIGIGRGIALILAREGVKTVLVSRRESLLRDLAREISESGGPPALVVAADLYERSNIDRIASTLREAGLQPDILINNAGGSRPVGVDAPDEPWDEAFAINFTPIRKLTQALLPSMTERRWGRIVNVTGSTEPSSVNAANAAKAAVHVWAKAVSREIGKHNITINCITPGRIRSEQMDVKFFPKDEQRDAFARERIPMGYFGEPEDLANLAVFLCSEGARYITGQRISVDGGLHRAVT